MFSVFGRKKNEQVQAVERILWGAIFALAKGEAGGLSLIHEAVKEAADIIESGIDPGLSSWFSG